MTAQKHANRRNLLNISIKSLDAFTAKSVLSKKRYAFIKSVVFMIILLSLILVFNACNYSVYKPSGDDGMPSVLTAEAFLADITVNICSDRLAVSSLIPGDMDPHAFEPSPEDLRKISSCDILIINGAGLEVWLDNITQNIREKTLIVEASGGLENRKADDGNDGPAGHAGENDPHFWLSPNLVLAYVENIKNALIGADPAGKDIYNLNAGKYIKELQELDNWIMQEVKIIPVEKRLMVTNHESFGYYADQYGFKIIGTIIPSSSTAASPSAKQTAKLIDEIKDLGVKAIFLETNADSKIADQISSETGAVIVSGLYTHSLTDAGGDAPTYIAMIKYNTKKIVEALK